MKKQLKGKRFATVEEVKTASQEARNKIKLHQFQRCFTQWEKRLDKCIASNEEFLKGIKCFFVRNVNKSCFLKKILFFFGSPPRICSPRYPACNVHEPSGQTSGPALKYFSTLSHKPHDFPKKKKIESEF